MVLFKMPEPAVSLGTSDSCSGWWREGSALCWEHGWALGAVCWEAWERLQAADFKALQTLLLKSLVLCHAALRAG